MQYLSSTMHADIPGARRAEAAGRRA
uniref:Uncharacterized protein n=1 Tax=Arundo donax TaxID=35708 RepID=A0A0A9FIK1_ARUDO